jgi:phosphoribosylglycinamide formyltransferase-1
MKKLRLAVFASGKGTNAANIVDYFKNHDNIEVAFVLSNNPSFQLPNRAAFPSMQIFHLSAEETMEASFLLNLCKEETIDYVILAGYLKLIPSAFIHAFENKIINIHPSLLPKYGGRGMYGDHVHKAVLAGKEETSGISIHFVNEEFDKGKLIAQMYCSVDATDEVSDLKARVQRLEQAYYPVVIERTILS